MLNLYYTSISLIRFNINDRKTAIETAFENHDIYPWFKSGLIFKTAAGNANDGKLY